MMEVISDSELKSQGFMILVRTFGDVNAERFIALVNRGNCKTPRAARSGRLSASEPRRARGFAG